MLNRGWGVLLITWVGCGPATQATTETQVSQTIARGAPRVSLRYHVSGNQLLLDAVGDAAEPAAYAIKSVDLWELELRDRRGQVVANARPSNSTFATFTVAPSSDGGLTAIWRGGRTAQMPEGETFEVWVSAARATDQTVFELSIAVQTTTPTLALDHVDFPRLRIAPRGAPSSQRIAFPASGGTLLPDPIANPGLAATQGIWLPHPGAISMQWFAYYDQAAARGPVLFWGTRDSAGYRKHFELGSDGQTIGTMLRHTPENNRALDGDYKAPFIAVLGVLRGDWYDAARYYRSWALEQPWMAQGPMRTDTTLSSLVKDATAFGGFAIADDDDDNYRYWQRDIEDQLKYFGIDQTPMLTYGWHSNPFDQDWGNWFPVKPGFVTYASQVSRRGLGIAPYVLVELYSAHDGVASYRDSYVPGFVGDAVRDYALVDPEGQVRMTTNPAGVPLPAVPLCHAAEKSGKRFTSEYAKYLATRLYDETGARGVYLDVLSFAESDACYSPSHGHPVGGGRYMTDAKRALVRDLKQTMRARDPEYFVYSEAQNEMFVGLADLVYAHNTGEALSTVSELAPLYSAVYHDYQATGRVMALHIPQTMTPEQIRAQRRMYAAHVFMGYAPYIGSVMSKVSIGDVMAASPAYARYLELVRDVIGLLRGEVTRRHVFFGERLRDPRTVVTTIAPQPGDSLLMPYGARQPLVYTAAFKNSAGPGIALLLVNWTDEDDIFEGGARGGKQSVTVTLNPSDYAELAQGSYSLREITTSGTRTLSTVSWPQTVTRSITVPARSAKLITIGL